MVCSMVFRTYDVELHVFIYPSDSASIALQQFMKAPHSLCAGAFLI